ncbi:MAG TPA: PilZ domain-containing protein, partial [Candidatus Acidoferrales bacterium]|nr:PilZ domain-containing protein [Candidatus Acidoferrales bacterium]
MDIERRQHERQKLYSPEYVDMGAENGGVVVDLSEAGLGFHAVGRVEKGGNVTLSFSLGSGYRIAARARVAWVGPNGKFGGTTFTAMPADSRSIIREWLTKSTAERTAPHETHGVAPAVDPETIADDNERVSLLPPIIERVETPRAPFPASPPPLAQPPETLAASVPVSHAIAPLPEDSPNVTMQEPRDQETRHDTQDSPSLSPTLSPIALPLEFSAEAAEQKTEPAELPVQSEIAAPPVIPSRPVFPPRNTGELFSRSPWISGQSFPEEPRSHKRLIAVIAICVLVIASIASVPYVRAHRQQIGDAIMQAGRKVAGESAPSATPQTQIPAQPSSQLSGQSAAPAQKAPSPAAAASAAGSAAPGSGTTGNSVPANPPAASATLLSPAAVAPATSNAAPTTSASQPPAKLHQALPSPNTPNASANRTSQTATSPPSTAILVDTGQTEFQRAEQYLNGTGVPANPAEAAQWFWRSFEKGNSSAAIPLASLYLKGQGVSRSCLQARILLSVAARKGNADAAERLS